MSEIKNIKKIPKNKRVIYEVIKDNLRLGNTIIKRFSTKQSAKSFMNKNNQDIDLVQLYSWKRYKLQRDTWCVSQVEQIPIQFRSI